LYAIPRDLPWALENALRGLEINELYSHQIEALDCLRKGWDLSIITPTASGKTLCYNLAILEDCLNRPQTSALYIFPLKALAFDQFRLPPTYCRNISPRTACKSKTNDRRYST
jgi:DEAD/DEAH box helicase domain-containing protein